MFSCLTLCAVLFVNCLLIHSEVDASDESQHEKETKPNIVIILADDMASDYSIIRLFICNLIEQRTLFISGI